MILAVIKERNLPGPSWGGEVLQDAALTEGTFFASVDSGVGVPDANRRGTAGYKTERYALPGVVTAGGMTALPFQKFSFKDFP